MYAVVKAGGKQHKVAVGDVVEVNRLDGEAGDSISLPALLIVDGADVTTEGAALAKITVTGEIVGHHKGPKIKILKYKNKTGYRKRIGHRQHLTELLVTDIDDGKPKKKKAAAKTADKAETTESDTVKADADIDTAEKSSAKKTAATKATPTAAAKTTTAKAASTSTSASTSLKDTVAKSAKATSADRAETTTADSNAAKASTAKPAKATKPTASKTSKSTDEKED